MALSQRITGADGKDSLVIFLSSGELRPVTQEHPKYNEIIEALANKATDEVLSGLIDPATHIFTRTQRVSDRFTLAGGTLLFDGDPVEGPLASFIVEIAANSDTDKSYAAWINFAEKLATNPSDESKEHLFHFMTTHGTTITPEGDLVLYKGVKRDGGSIHEGPGIVDGVQMNGSLPNAVGSVLEFPRSKVNANRGIGCATGLHAGTFEYASSFAQGRLLTVTVNPRDVVSVPSDHSNAKVRVARYTVVEINEQESKYDAPVWGDVQDDDFEDDSDIADDWFPEDESDEDEDEAEEVAAPAPNAEFESSVQEALTRIPAIIKGGWDKSLNLYASKHITAARREAFREAIRRTGLR